MLVVLVTYYYWPTSGICPFLVTQGLSEASSHPIMTADFSDRWVGMLGTRRPIPWVQKSVEGLELILALEPKAQLAFIC